MLYVMLFGCYPFDGVSETIDVQIRKGRISFASHRGEISKQAQSLILAFVKLKPSDRKPLAEAFSDPWVNSQGGPKRLQKLCTEEGGSVHEESVPLPSTPSRQQFDQLRGDLDQWSKKWKCFARTTSYEIVARYGLETHVEGARGELQSIVSHYFGTCPPLRAYHASAGVQRPRAPQMESIPEGKARRSRNFVHALVVSDTDGAGLDLLPEDNGMRIVGICGTPGQPGLQQGDLIVRIEGVALQGRADHVEQMFGMNFGNGAQLGILREG